MTTTMNPRAAVAGAVTAVLVLALLLALGPRGVSVPDRPAGDPELAAFLRDHAPRGAGSLTAFVISDGTVRFAGQGADENTEHEIGSVTKPMVGELLHDAVESGSVSMSTRVGEVLPTQDAPASDVTLRELAAHTSGLPRLGPLGVTGWLRSLLGQDPYTGITADDLVTHAREAELSDRGEMEYSNLGVALLGEALARSAGTGFSDLFDQGVVTPLGMTATYVATDETVPADAPRGHGRTGRPAAPWNSEGYAAAGSVRSTSRDMARFAEHMLRTDREPVSWIKATEGEHEVMWHNGGTGGYSTMLVIHRPTGTAAYVATDSTASVDDLGLALFAHLHDARQEN